MIESIGKVIIDYSSYDGEDVYSDGEVEKQLLEIVQSNTDFTDIIKNEKSWPILYHLSEIRENVIDWIDIDTDDTVLEIGAGCGAITGALCSKAKKVIANDLSKQRSLINAYRNKNCDNLEIRVGNFQSVSETLEMKFDYITLIGVFEYAGFYMDGAAPFHEMLESLKTLMNDKGKIIIAIENRLGLKYWAGCKEDHVGKYFEGIEGYTETEGIRTFSKPELIEMFEKCGFTFEFYYPYPDYKLPVVIYSDNHLPKEGELIHNMRNFDQNRLALFDETKVYDSLINNHLFQLFSNSFIIVLEKEVCQ